MVEQKRFSVMVAKDNWSPMMDCRLYINKYFFKIVDMYNTKTEYRYDEVSNLSMYFEYAKVELNSGDSFVFQSAQLDLFSLMSKVSTGHTSLVFTELQYHRINAEHNDFVSRTGRNIEITLISRKKEEKRLLILDVNKSYIEILENGVVVSYLEYRQIEKAEMKSDFGCIRLKNGKEIEFIFGWLENGERSNVIREYTELVTVRINRAKLSLSSYPEEVRKKGNSAAASAIRKFIQRGPVNQDYWQFYERNSLEQGNVKSDAVNTEFRMMAKSHFQNAICYTLLGKYKNAVKIFSYMKERYKQISPQTYGSTDLFRFFAAAYLGTGDFAKEYLTKAIDILENRKYSDYEEKDIKPKGGPGGGNMKRMYRLVDYLQLCRIGFIAGLYEEVVSAAENGIKLLSEIKADKPDGESALELNPENSLALSAAETYESRLELYGKMFVIIPRLTNCILSIKSDISPFTEELPEFFDKYINPVPKDYSNFSIEEEVQWGLIFLLSCQRIIGLFKDLPPRLGLRKFLG